MVDVDHELELARLHRERQHDEPERETTRPDGDDDDERQHEQPDEPRAGATIVGASLKEFDEG